jgi:cytochrome P450
VYNPSRELDTSTPGWSFQMVLEQDFARDPRPYFARLRAGCPARDELRVEGREPTVVVSRWQDIETVFRNPRVFSSRFGDNETGIGNERPLIPLQIDPPEHKKYRVLLDPYFSPRRMAALEGEVAQLANQFIDGFIDRGSCEFMADFAVPFPCTVFLRLVGLPVEDLDYFLKIKDGITRANGETDFSKMSEVRKAAGKECYAYFEAHLDNLSKHPDGRLLSDLLNAEVDGERLTREEILDICYLLIIAGLDTVTDSLCCFWAYLAENPEQRRRIVEDPSKIPAAVEELLRWESPVSVVARVAADDTEVGGCPVHKGEGLLLFVGAANTDETALEGADRVDFDRPANKHYAFGGGIHRCLGSHLARSELRVAMREWHRRIPDYHIAEGVELQWTPMLRQVNEMPLVFTK